MITLKNSAEKVHLFASKRTNRVDLDPYINPEALFEFAGQGIIVARPDGEIVKINGAAELMFGYQPRELLIY